MNRRNTTVLASASAALVLSGACVLPGTVFARAQDHITLTMWQQWGGGHEEATLKKIIKEYERLHPNITIVETPVTDNSKILTAISGGNPPDIIDMGTSGVLGDWASKGALTDLTPYIQSDKSFSKNAFVQSGWNSVTVNGKPYALPFMNFDAALLYNKDTFKKAGITHPPRTLEELQQDAFKLTQTDKSGKIIQAGFIPDYPVSNIESYAWMFGGQWMNPKTGKFTGEDPRIIQAFNWEQVFYKKVGAQKLANFVKSAGAYLSPQDPFQSGKLAMVYDGSWVIAYIEQNNPNLLKNIGVAPMPGPKQYAAGGGTTYIDTNPQVIPTGAKHPQDAWNFIAWETTNPQIAGEFATLVANIPQLKKPQDFKLGNDPLYKVFISEANSPKAHSWPQSQTSSEYLTKLAAVDQGILFGNTPALAAMKQLDSQFNG